MQEMSSESGQPAIGTVLVTGASRGIGLDFVRAWLERGVQVIAGCRNPTGASALGTLMSEHGERLRVMQLDVTDERSVETMAGALGNLNIDLLINNAGILQVESLENMDFASIIEQFKVNALGALQVTRALLSNLRDGAKIINITSRMGSLDDNTSGGYYGYRMSKAALNAGAKSLAIDLAPQGAAVAILHPGFVRTRMTGGNGQLEPAESARMLIARIDALDAANSGTFWHANGDVLPW